MLIFQISSIDALRAYAHKLEAQIEALELSPIFTGDELVTLKETYSIQLSVVRKKINELHTINQIPVEFEVVNA